jgi:hypothetical protein
MFSDDVILFAAPVPGFSHGRQQAQLTLAQALGAEHGVSDWTAIRAGVSADGEHGFTFGYMTTRNGEAGAVDSKYLAYWIRGADEWRVALFKLAPRAAGDVSLAAMSPSLPRGGQTAFHGANSEARASLARREQEFSDAAAQLGLGPAFARFGRDDASNMGDGPSFVIGAANIARTQPSSPPSPVVWSADEGVIVAASGDLGVTWGYLRRIGPTPPGRLARIPFFTVWRRDGPDEPWLYIAE